MSLIGILVVLLLIGLLLWAVQTAVPLDPTIRRLIQVVVVVAVVIWLLQAFGLLGSLHDVRIR